MAACEILDSGRGNLCRIDVRTGAIETVMFRTLE
jgi:hypothetical protein